MSQVIQSSAFTSHNGRRLWMGFFAAAMLAVLTGCPKPQPQAPLPAPITAEQQIAQVNQRSTKIVQLKLTGDVKLTWQHEKKTRSENAEGTLWIQRAMARNVSGTPVMTHAALFVTKLGQPAVEMGVNREHHWLAFRGDVAEAYVGEIKTEDRVPLRADLLVDLLGITTVDPAAQFTMTRNDHPGTNAIYEWKTQTLDNGQGTLRTQRYLARTIVIDRRSDEIREIRLYQPNGALLARSELSRYEDVLQQKEDGDPAASGVRLPSRVMIEYPSRQAALQLSLKGFVMPLRIKPDTFKMPDFAKQGLKVIPWKEER